ncbi:MAG TPA: M20/M25/M40 family metallo-hydrolase, partial [Gemmatimonadaceae bacterium]
MRIGIIVAASAAAFIAISTPRALAAQGAPSGGAARAVPAAARAWWHDITVLADDSLRGRATGSSDYLTAARYVESEFRKAGLAPIGGDANDPYFQTVHLETVRLVPDRSGVALVSGGTIDTLALDKDVFIDVSTTTPAHVDAPMVFVGYGLHFPGTRDDLGNTSVRGKIAVYLNRLPSGLSATVMAHTRSGRWDALRAAGAVGAIAITEPPAPGSRAARFGIRGRSVVTGLADDPAGGGVMLVMPDSTATFSVERLFVGSGHRYAELRAMADRDSAAILPTFALTPTFSVWTELTRTPLEAPNVLGVLRGSDPGLRNQYVIVSAHLDHLGVGRPVNGDSIYNGAMDNASGIATMLEVARAFHAQHIRPKRSLIFAAVTAEEKGELGSAYYATHPTVPVHDIVADLNTDMWEPLIPLRGVFGYGAHQSDLGNDLAAALAAHGLTLMEDPHPEQVRFIRSDQYSFIK